MCHYSFIICPKAHDFFYHNSTKQPFFKLLLKSDSIKIKHFSTMYKLYWTYVMYLVTVIFFMENFKTWKSLHFVNFDLNFYQLLSGLPHTAKKNELIRISFKFSTFQQLKLLLLHILNILHTLAMKFSIFLLLLSRVNDSLQGKLNF